MRGALAALAVWSGGCGGCSSEHKADAGLACTGDPISEMGEGTYYDANGTGNCSFDPSPNDLMVAAMNAADYDHAAWCGACLAVSGPNGEITVRVVDQCPGCKHGDLDLSKEAFAMLAPLATGRIRIAWHEVACPVQGPIGYHMKDGSNAFWTAIQLRDHRYPIDVLEARDAAGAYHPIARADYNYFVAPSGLGAGPYTLRVTDVHGHVLEDANIALGDAVLRPGAGQFPVCP
jgi:expansin (peptidoglycan-binding protein)